MKEIRKIDLGLNGYEELFMSSEERADAKKPKVEEVEISELFPFMDHPFKVKQDEELKNLMESIRNFGVLVPALARPKEGGGYELVSGHRRMTACKALGIEKMPVIIRDLTDEEAVITMVDANLQREHILPSEKAFAYKMKMEALKSQGKRTDITSSQVATRFDAASEIGKGSGESRDQVFRYIRLTNLIPEILQMVDDGKIALTPAVELSYLLPEEQRDLLMSIESEDCTPSYSQAVRMRKLSEQGLLSPDSIFKIMSEVKGNQKEYLKLPTEKYDRYLKRFHTLKEKEDFIEKALDYYCRYLERNRERER